MKVLGISGSLRRASYNRKLLTLARRFAEESGAEVSEADLKDLALPVYDQDIEDAGMPDSVAKLRAMVQATDVILIASPEYNHSIPGGLKNAIDWLSRGGNVLDGKVAAIFGTSPGSYGTARMQPDLRKVLAALNVSILPQPQLALPFAEQAFNEDGSLKDKKMEERLKLLVQKTLALKSST